jgi:hypothetical protein
MKATLKQYLESIQIFDALGQGAVWELARRLGLNSFSRCEGCDEETPTTEAAGDCCFICGSVKK